MSEQSIPARTNEQEVEYRDVPGFPGYQVGSDGSVLGRRNRKSGRLLRGWRRADGYRSITLFRGGVRFDMKAHILVLLAFVGPRPDGYETRHLNGDRADDRLSNLCWGTRLENADDKRRHGTMMMGERVPLAKLTAREVVAIRAMVAAGATHRATAACFGVDHSQVTRIMNGQHWKHVS